MDSINISEFKATCLALLARVAKTGEPLEIRKRGVPIAIIYPPRKAKGKPKFGSFKNKYKELGDIVSPLGTEDWEVFK